MKMNLLLGLLLMTHFCSGQNNADQQSYKNQETSAVFEENKGQMKDQFWNPRPDVLYYGTSEGMNYYIKNSGMSYQLSRVESWKDEEDPRLAKTNINDATMRKVPDQIGTYRVDAEWLDANADLQIIKGKVLDGYNNYYNVPEGVEPALFVKKYETLTLKNVWDGIDLHYYGTNGFLETDYLVAPGADFRKIQIQFKGAELSTDTEGNLIIKTPFGEIQEGTLKVYQNNERIEASWKISEDNVVSFEIPNYNADLALRIDPLTRVWGTYYGGEFMENGHSICTDIGGNLFLTGYSESISSIASGGHQNLLGGYADAFIVKFNNSGVRQWATYYGGAANDYGVSNCIDASGNVFVAGHTQSSSAIAFGGHQNYFGGGSDDAFLVKFNNLGLRLWGTYYGGASDDFGMSSCVDEVGNVYLSGQTGSDTDIAFTGHQNSIGGSIDAFLVKFSSSGLRIWATYYGGDNSEQGWSSCVDAIGNVYLAGSTSSISAIASLGHQSIYGGGSDAFLVKFDGSGSRQWGTYYGGLDSDNGFSCTTDNFGNVYLSGRTMSTSAVAYLGHQNTIGGDYDAFLVKFSSVGVRLWGTYYGGMEFDESYSNYVDNYGSIYLAGSTQSQSAIAFGGFQNFFEGFFDAFIVKFDGSGSRQWGTYYGGTSGDDCFSTIIDENSNVYIAGGTFSVSSTASGGHQNSFGGVRDAFLVKFKQPKISGLIWLDNNLNCLREPSETALIDGVNLIIHPGNYVTQSINGFWSVDSLPAGNYTITIDTTNLNWISSCPITQSFAVTNPNGFTDGPNFGLISTNPCSDPDVSIFAPFLRPCLQNQMIYISACNQTTATGALNASYVDVELDPLMAVTGSSLPFTNQGNNIYRFQTGTLYPGQCVNFSISTTISSPTLSCAELLGLTLCMDANLYPVQSCALDTIPSDPPSGGGGSTGGGTLDGLPVPCTLPWDQSSLSVDGWCQNDTIYFTITNTGQLGGGDMECYSPVWVTVDGVVTFTDSIMIQGGQTVTYSFPGDGATWILNAEQHPLHPGNSHPNAHVEACGSDISNWTPDLVNDFPQDDADPVVDIYCGVVTGSYDPNDKTGYPNGVTDLYYIQPNQQLQYVIRFQNTGTDTAFTVVIRDTLDTDLNIFTVTPGVSSHSYEFRMYGPRVLEWTFNNINLPDSTTDQEGSNGFVTFHVEQVPDLAPGTEITNDADIYFDFNDPITTNTTMHRIYEGFVSVADLEEMSKENARILVYPNPNNGEFTIVLEDNSVGNYSILDQQGRVVKTGTLDGLKTTIELELQNGMYYLMVDDGVVKFHIK